MDQSRQTRQLFALLRHAGVTERHDRLAVMAEIVQRDIGTANDLTSIEARAVIDTLDYWKRLGELQPRCRAITNPGAVGAERRTVRGHQLVQVRFDNDDSGRSYTYAWAGADELAVGDRVQTPVKSWPPESTDPATATVCALGSDYEGAITVLTKKADQ